MSFKFNNHHDIEGMHAFLSPSGHSWLNYDAEKLITVFENKKRAEHGTKLHAMASELIKEGLPVARRKGAWFQFVNDSIGFNMESEKILFYSPYCFGTADAIKYENKKLTIFDLKTGVTPASFEQLNVYAALFCLEYGFNPKDIEIEERIYQFDGYEINLPDGDNIKMVMEQIIECDRLLTEYVNANSNR